MKFFKNIFALSGDKNTINDDGAGPLVTYEAGFPAPYSLEPDDPSAKFVERGDMNELFSVVTESLKLWQTGTYPEFIESTQNDGANFPYGIGSIVKRGGVTYVSTANSNTTIPAAVGANWVPLDLRKPDVEFVELTAGTNALTQTINGTYTYNIADFVGTDLNTEDIRKIHLDVYVESPDRFQQPQITATFPDGSTHVIGWSTGGGPLEADGTKTICEIPINKGQSSFTVTIGGGSGTKTFKITGATQRTLNF